MNDNMRGILNLPIFVEACQFLLCVKSAPPVPYPSPQKQTLHKEVDFFFFSKFINGHHHTLIYNHTLPQLRCTLKAGNGLGLVFWGPTLTSFIPNPYLFPKECGFKTDIISFLRECQSIIVCFKFVECFILCSGFIECYNV